MGNFDTWETYINMMMLCREVSFSSCSKWNEEDMCFKSKIHATHADIFWEWFFCLWIGFSLKRSRPVPLHPQWRAFNRRLQSLKGLPGNPRSSHPEERFGPDLSEGRPRWSSFGSEALPRKVRSCGSRIGLSMTDLPGWCLIICMFCFLDRGFHTHFVRSKNYVFFCH